MKIGLVIANYRTNGGGAERWTDRHARWLMAWGHEVHLIASSFSGPPEGAVLHHANLQSVRGWPSRLRFGAAAEAVLRRLELDAVHDQGDGWHCSLFMPHHGTRVGGFLQNSRLAPKPLRPFRELAFRLLPRYRQFAQLERQQFAPSPGKLFIALSNRVADDMARHYGVQQARIRVVPNGVDINYFQPADRLTRERSRAALDVGHSNVFLLVAHNFRLKGLDELLRAIARRKERGCCDILLVAGNGDIGGYRRQSKRLGCNDRVRFLGDHSDPRSLYAAADAYIHPTYYDPCSLVVLEALASGLPVVTTRYNGASELMTDGVEGYALSEPDDAMQLDAALTLLDDSERRKDMAAAARLAAEQNTIELNARRLVELYRAAGSRIAA